MENSDTTTGPDRYDFREVIGRGANALTRVAEDLETGRLCAIKELRIGDADSFQTIRLFERETSVLQELDHPGIPDYIDSFELEDEDGAALCLVQEFVDGPTLEEACDQQRRTEDEILEVLAEVLDIADYLHDRSPPVVHRDIKPENIVLRDQWGDPALVDFGSVRTAVSPEDDERTVTGTVGYMAPEQFAGEARPATDVYGVAATAIRLLSGKPPSDLLTNTNELDWRPHTDVAAPTEALLDAMLSRDPEGRPSDAGRLSDTMRRVARGEVVEVRELPEPVSNVASTNHGRKRAAAEPEPGARDAASAATTVDPEPTDASDDDPDASHQWSVSEDPPRPLPEDFTRRLCADRSKALAGYVGGAFFLIAFFFFIQLDASHIDSNAYGALIVISLGPAALLFGWGYVQRRRCLMAKKTYREGRLTTGEVSESESYGRHRKKVKYRFTVDEESETSRVGSTVTRVPKIPASGDPVPVLYREDNPRKNLGVVDYKS